MHRVLFPLALGLIGTAVLVSLGVWQVQRLGWKENVLTQIEGRISGEPITLPISANPEQHRYMPVLLSGQVGTDELYVLTSRKHVGAGYLVIVPFTTREGRRILVDLGFIDAEAKGTKRFSAEVTISGHLNWPDDRNGSTPDNDIDGNIWFARDVAEMAAELGTEPLMVILASSTADLGPTPLPVDISTIPNDHLEYAITWFSLAAIWITMSVVLVIRIFKKKA